MVAAYENEEEVGIHGIPTERQDKLNNNYMSNYYNNNNNKANIKK